jgi:hypothetical protein
MCLQVQVNAVFEKARAHQTRANLEALGCAESQDHAVKQLGQAEGEHIGPLAQALVRRSLENKLAQLRKKGWDALCDYLTSKGKHGEPRDDQRKAAEVAFTAFFEADTSYEAHIMKQYFNYFMDDSAQVPDDCKTPDGGCRHTAAASSMLVCNRIT